MTWLAVVAWCAALPAGEACAARVLPVWLPDAETCAAVKAIAINAALDQGAVWVVGACHPVRREAV